MKKRLLSQAYITAMVIIGLLLVSSHTIVSADENQITRGEAVQTLYDTFYIDAVQLPAGYVAETRFYDLHGCAYAKAAIWAGQAGIVLGDGNGRFGGDRHLTRVEAALMFERVISAYSTEDAGDIGVSDHIPQYSDLNTVPEWAVSAMASAVTNGYLSSVDGQLSPDKTISRTEFVEAIGAIYNLYRDMPNYPVHPESIDYTGLTARNPSTSSDIYLGMTIGEVSEIFGMSIKNGWEYFIDGAFLICYNGLLTEIRIVNTSDCDWSLNGCGISSSKEDIETVFGQPDREIAKGSVFLDVLPLNDSVQYCFTSAGEDAKSGEDGVYFLEVSYGEEGHIVAMSVCSYNKPERNYSSTHRGVVNIEATGSGDSSITNTVADIQLLTISYSGAGDISILSGDSVLFTHGGPYHGTILLRDTKDVELTVRADGDWSILGEYSPSPMYSYKTSGTGDYVFPTMGLAGEYLITHTGSDRLEVLLVPMLADPAIDSVTVADIEGNYSGSVTIDDRTNSGYVVIRTDGDWSFEPKFSFVVAAD